MAVSEHFPVLTPDHHWSRKTNRSSVISVTDGFVGDVLVLKVAFNNWRDAMSLTQLKLKNQIRVSRPRKVIDKTVAKAESLLGTSGASLTYAGYPYDPYA